MVKDQDGVDLQIQKYRVLDKIVVKKYVEYYAVCWKEYNKEYHDEAKQRSRVVKWYEKVKVKAESGVDEQLKKYVQKHQIEVEQYKTETVRRWINNVREFERKLEKIPKEDIRRYFVT